MPCKRRRLRSLFDPARRRLDPQMGRNPTSREIQELAMAMYADDSARRYGMVTMPEIDELKETGYWEDARRALLGSGAGRRNVRGYDLASEGADRKRRIMARNRYIYATRKSMPRKMPAEVPPRYIMDPPVTKQQAGYIERGPYPYVCGNCKHIRWGGSRSDSCAKVTGEISPNASCKLFEMRANIEARKKVAKQFDPAKLPKPDDFPGYDNLNNIRLVPTAKAPGYNPVHGLIEAQIVMPQHQFDGILKKVKAKLNYKDLEYADEDHDGVIDRIVRRGRRNNQTNIFIDRE